MKQKDIIDAWVRIRQIDQTIPDDVLDFMKDTAIEKLNSEHIGLLRNIYNTSHDPKIERMVLQYFIDNNYSLNADQ